MDILKDYALLPKLAESVINYGNPYFQPNETRKAFGQKLRAKEACKGTQILFYMSCGATFDPTTNFMAEAMVNILEKAQLPWGMLGQEELCCGLPLLDTGLIDEFRYIARKNIDNINQLGINTLVTVCAGCYHTIKNEWQKVAPINWEVKHSSQYILELIGKGRLKLSSEFHKKIALHDPCLLARENPVLEEPRQLLKKIAGVKFVEMPRNKEKTWCCGAGGLSLAILPIWASETSSLRLEEAVSAGAETMVISSCPTCYLTFDMALHGYASAIKLYQDLWKKMPSLGKFLTTAHKIASPFLRRKEKIELEILDLTHLMDRVTS